MEHKRDIENLFRAVKAFHDKDELNVKFSVQHNGLIPLLRPYQVKAVEWMVHKEIQPILYNLYLHCGKTSDADEDQELVISKLPTGGILAEEMGLGKTVEVLACILSNPRKKLWSKTSPVKEENILDSEENQLSGACRDVHEQETASSQVKEVSNDTLKNRLTLSSKDLLKWVKQMKRRNVDRDDWPLSVRDAEVKSFKRNSLLNGKVSKTPRRRKSSSTSEFQASSKKTISRQAAEAWYLHKLSEVKTNPIRAYRESLQGSYSCGIQCICGENSSDLKVVRCKNCDRQQHSACIGATSKLPGQPIYCPECWLKQDPVESGTTLIVSPTSISGQWLSEVQNHVKQSVGLKVLVYKGVRVDGFSQPYELAKYDLILTTYEVLRSELVLADVPEKRSLRYTKRYFTPTCPLVCVQFWRVCLDEAQMVEGTTTMAAEMVSRLSSIHRWAVTGTPIQKTVNDLYGLVMFLGVEPFCERVTWQNALMNPFFCGNKVPLQTLMAYIMWRSSKKDVLDQIQLPAQTEQIWWLNFSPVEEHFYHRTHNECSNAFLEGLLRFDSLNVTLDSLKVVTVNRVLAPLLKLRQACSHPQAVRGNLITAQKGAITMGELLESLIKKTKFEGEEALRLHIASLNGIAGLHIICNEFVSAAEKYRSVLQIAEEYKNRFKVDTLQRLHTLHNLAGVIESHRKLIPPTLRDDSLREEESQLEVKYMSKAQNQVTSVEDALSELKAGVLHLENELSEIDDPDWWVELSHWLCINDGDAVLTRVHEALLDNRKSVPEITSGSIINRVASHGGIRSEIGTWLEHLEQTRDKALKSLHTLQVTDAETLVGQAVDCHLRLSNLKKKVAKASCELCICESLLKNYEIRLFDIKNKKQENEMVGDVILLGQANQGSWKPSEPERVLRVLVTMGKQKKAHELVSKGIVALKHFDALRKEFKHLRMLWTRINERTCARDELNMCKLRLRLREPHEAVPSTSSTQVNRRKREAKQLSTTLDTKMENLHIIEPHKVEAMSLSLNSDATAALSELRKKSGTLVYLQNLRQKGNESESNTNPELCPICQNTLGEKWSVLSCGHCFCMDCMPQLMRKKQNQTSCAVCREMTNNTDISFVNLTRHGTGDELSESADIPKVQGSHSTKVEAVIRQVFHLKAMDPSVKVLVFSTWDRVLDILEYAMGQNNIKHLRLKSGQNYQLTLHQFKDRNCEEPATALLLPLKLGAKGLNLTEATHVMLVEPILNPADELQAIGRVHRIGQTRPTVVHRFLIQGTIEERMFSAVQATGKEQWDGDRVTLKQLKDLFTVPIHTTMSNQNCSSDASGAESMQNEQSTCGNEVEAITSTSFASLENGADMIEGGQFQRSSYMGRDTNCDIDEKAHSLIRHSNGESQVMTVDIPSGERMLNELCTVGQEVEDIASSCWAAKENGPDMNGGEQFQHSSSVGRHIKCSMDELVGSPHTLMTHPADECQVVTTDVPIEESISDELYNGAIASRLFAALENGSDMNSGEQFQHSSCADMDIKCGMDETGTGHGRCATDESQVMTMDLNAGDSECSFALSSHSISYPVRMEMDGSVPSSSVAGAQNCEMVCDG